MVAAPWGAPLSTAFYVLSLATSSHRLTFRCSRYFYFSDEKAREDFGDYLASDALPPYHGGVGELPSDTVIPTRQASSSPSRSLFRGDSQLSRKENELSDVTMPELVNLPLHVLIRF